MEKEINNDNARIELFKKECSLANLPFIRVGQVYTEFWDKLYEIITQKSHEQKEIQSGYIFTKEYNEKDFNSDISSEIKDYYLDSSTNGKNTFCLFSKSDNKTRTLIYRSELSPTDLLSYTTDSKKNNIVITRSNSETRIYYHGTISVLDNREWSIYNNQRDNIEIIKKEINSIPNNFDILLDFAYYDLAVSKIGTTLVYCLDENIDLSKVKAKTPQKPIDLKNTYEQIILKNYAQNHDGAIIVDSDIQVLKINAKLPFDNSTLSKIQSEQFTGMRHTSSAAYSFENSNTIIITVSDDGGATVFKNGKVILNMKSELLHQTIHEYRNNNQINFISLKPEKTIIKKKVARVSNPILYRTLHDKLNKTQEFADQVGENSETGSTTAICPKCGQEYLIGYVKITGWNDHEELECEKCGTTYYSKSCFELIGEPINNVNYEN